MMALIYVLCGLVLAVVLVVTHLAMWSAGAKRAVERDIQKILRKARVTKEDVFLYRRAAKIMSRIVNLADVEATLIGQSDILSDRTRKQVDEWLADYKKELDKAYER